MSTCQRSRRESDGSPIECGQPEPCPHHADFSTPIARAAEKMREFADLYGDESSQSGAAHAAIVDWMEEVAAWQCEGLGHVRQIDQTNFPDMWVAMVEHATKVAEIWLGGATFPPGDPEPLQVRCSHVGEHGEQCGQDEIGDWWRPAYPAGEPR